MDTTTTATSRPRWTRWLRWIIGGATAVGAGIVSILILAIGHCSAFGGRCPAEPVPLLEDDVFGSIALVIGVATAVVGICIRPDRRGVLRSVVAAVPVGLLVGYVAAVLARG